MSEQLTGAVPGRLYRTRTVGLLCLITAFHGHENTCKVTVACKPGQRHTQALSKHAQSGREVVVLPVRLLSLQKLKTLTHLTVNFIDFSSASQFWAAHLSLDYNRVIIEMLQTVKFSTLSSMHFNLLKLYNS